MTKCLPITIIGEEVERWKLRGVKRTVPLPVVREKKKRRCEGQSKAEKNRQRRRNTERARSETVNKEKWFQAKEESILSRQCKYIYVIYAIIKVLLHSHQFSSVDQSCLTLCDPMNCSTPGLHVHHQLPESTQTHVHLNQWCHPTISFSDVPFSSCPQSFSASGSFPMSGQSTGIGVSASASVLPVNTQDWSPLGWTGWISFQSKGLSRVFSKTTVQRHQFFGAQLSL